MRTTQQLRRKKRKRERYITNTKQQTIDICKDESGDNEGAPAGNDAPAQGPTVTRKDLISKKEDVQINALR